MVWLMFFGLFLAGLIGMELFSYVVHRWIFHGPLWKIHATHHRPAEGVFELNDLFFLAFALVSMALMVTGGREPLDSAAFPVGLGIAVYGSLYFIVHDLFTHRRFLPFVSDGRVMQTIRRAHQRHHQTAEKEGFEPYGLFLFPYGSFRRPYVRKRDVVDGDESLSSGSAG